MTGRTSGQWERAGQLWPRVRRAVARKTGAGAVDDAVAEAMARAYLCDADTDEAIENWLVVVAQRRAIDAARKDANRRAAEAAHGAAEVPEAGTAEEVERRAKAVLVAGFVNALPDFQRQSVTLRGDGLSVREVAAKLGKTPEAVESALSRARANVRAAVDQAWSAPPIIAARRLARGRPRRAAWLGLAASVCGLTLLSPAMPWRSRPTPAAYGDRASIAPLRPTPTATLTARAGDQEVTTQAPADAASSWQPQPGKDPAEWRPALPSPLAPVGRRKRPDAPRDDPDESMAACVYEVAGSVPSLDPSCLVSVSPSPTPTATRSPAT